MAIRDAFGAGASHGVIIKTYSVTHLVKEAQGRYSPAAVVAVERQVVSGDPDQYVSTSYVERQNLSLRMGSRRFTRLTNGFSKKLDNHVAAVALGLGLGGHLFTVTDHGLAALVQLLPVSANVGSGLLYLFCWLTNTGFAEQAQLVTYEYGNTFLLVAGLLNYLAALDAFDIAAGRKE